MFLNSIDTVGAITLGKCLLMKLLEVLGLKGNIVTIDIEVFTSGGCITFVELALKK